MAKEMLVREKRLVEEIVERYTGRLITAHTVKEHLMDKRGAHFNGSYSLTRYQYKAFFKRNCAHFIRVDKGVYRVR